MLFRSQAAGQQGEEGEGSGPQARQEVGEEGIGLNNPDNIDDVLTILGKPVAGSIAASPPISTAASPGSANSLLPGCSTASPSTSGGRAGSWAPSSRCASVDPVSVSVTTATFGRA